MKKIFNVSKTYSIYTKESISEGDQASNGFIYENELMSLRDIIDEVNDIGGISDINTLYSDIRSADSIDLYQANMDHDIYTGDKQQDCLHIDGSNRSLKRLIKILKAV